jgi:hypothetical protein
MKNYTGIYSISMVMVVCVSIILNLILPMVVFPFATSSQITPPNGAAALGMWDQIMHMLVHHKQVPLVSSLIVALIVLLSVVAGYFLTKLIKKYM